MSTDPRKPADPPFDDSAHAPPTRRAANVKTPRTSWPTVLGIISIVLATAGILIGLWSIVSYLFTDWLSSLMPPADRASYQALMSEVWIVAFIWYVLILIVACILLVGGIQLSRRRFSGVRICTTWAYCKIPLALFGSIVSYWMMQKQYELSGPETQMGQVPEGIRQVMTAATIAVHIAWGCALPVFLLIWFRRRKIREEIETWKQHDTSTRNEVS